MDPLAGLCRGRIGNEKSVQVEGYRSQDEHLPLSTDVIWRQESKGMCRLVEDQFCRWWTMDYSRLRPAFDSSFSAAPFVGFV